MAPSLTPGRLARVLAAVAVAAAAGVYAVATRGGGPAGGVGILVGLAVALFAAGLVMGRPGPVAFAVVGLSSVYLVGQIGQPVNLGATALFAVALLVVLELGWWSMEAGVPVAWEGAAIRRRWWALIALAAGGGALALAVGLAGVAGRGTSPVLFGAAAALAPAAAWAVVWSTKTATRR